MATRAPHRRPRPRPVRSCRECGRPVRSWAEHPLCPGCLKDVVAGRTPQLPPRPAATTFARVPAGQTSFDELVAGTLEPPPVVIPDPGSLGFIGPLPFEANPYDIPF